MTIRQDSTPYAASVPDKNGYVYASSNMAERVLRLDPKSRLPVGVLQQQALNRRGELARTRRGQKLFPIHILASTLRRRYHARRSPAMPQLL